MNASTSALVVSIIAVVIAAASATVALLALRTARNAHALNERRDRDERERREANEVGLARFVTLDVTNLGAPGIHIENSSPEPITAVRIESVECVDEPEMRVEPNRNVRGARSEWDVIAPGEQKMYPVILVNADGQRDDMRAFTGADVWRIVASWTDIRGQRWRRVSLGEPERIEG